MEEKVWVKLAIEKCCKLPDEMIVLRILNGIDENFTQANDGSLGTHLFVKVPRPGDSEVTFSVSNQAATFYY